MKALTPAEARARVLEAVGHLQALALMGISPQQRQTAERIASGLLGASRLIQSMEDELERLRGGAARFDRSRAASNEPEYRGAVQ